MRRVVTALAVMLLARASWASPQEALAVALADAKTLAKDDAIYVRYMDLSWSDPKDRMTKVVPVVNFWNNSLSRLKPKGKMVLLGTDAQVARIDLRDYGWKRETWELLGTPQAGEPYFHRIRVDLTKGGDGREVSKTVNAHATWLAKDQILELSTLTNSYSPIVRADWFVWTTGQQVDREASSGKGFGYYDFLGLGKKQQDFFDLILADPEKSRKALSEAAGRVGRSGVARNNRGVAGTGTLTRGSFWATADFKTSVGKQNVLRLLRDKDTQPPHGDASEQYGTAPNGLFVFFLVNDKGERQDSVPDFIAADPSGIANDLRIHPGRSCTICHREGLRPVNDFVRKTFTGPAQLRSLDKDIFLELDALYLNSLDRVLHRDNEVYRESLLEVNGLTPEKNSEAFQAFNQAYFGTDVTLAQMAFELGFTEEKFRQVLVKSATDTFARRALADPLIVALSKPGNDSVPMRREHFEELIPVFEDLMQGVIP